uniref:40S ribosomal protein S12 n=1 Tax=Suberites domuncula TaxID=55567 RepID=Q4KTD0_SUBDO|nr:S12 [Suberites domuncula]
MADMEGGDASQGMSITDALKEVLRDCQACDGLARGLREAVKCLDKRQALLCVLAKDCSEAAYVRLVEALCNEHQISLIKVDNKEDLGQWVGLCKIDKDGKPRKIVKCSCVVIKEITTATNAWDVIQEYIKVKSISA